MPVPPPPFLITPAEAGQTLAAVLRPRLAEPPLSWGAVRQLIEARRVQVNGSLCVDDARRLSAGERVTVLTESLRPPPAAGDLIVRYLGRPSGRRREAGRRAQRPQSRRGRGGTRSGRGSQPTLDELLQKRLPRPRGRAAANTDWRVRPVHRLDRDTSGLTLYALSGPGRGEADRAVSPSHEIERRLPGPSSTATWPSRRHVRDASWCATAAMACAAPVSTASRRPRSPAGRHPRPAGGTRRRSITRWSIARLETGRTHQIRIPPVRGRPPALRRPRLLAAGTPKWKSPRRLLIEDHSGAPRQVLHSQRVSFTHPMTGKPITFDAAWPADLAAWWTGLRGAKARSA